MWKHLLKMKQSYYLVLAYALSITIAILVYATGGTHNSIVNFMNIPILIASSTNRKSKGVIHAGISGLIVGPFMPLFTTTGTPQKPLY
jgi:hypothetical protein